MTATLAAHFLHFIHISCRMKRNARNHEFLQIHADTGKLHAMVNVLFPRHNVSPLKYLKCEL